MKLYLLSVVQPDGDPPPPEFLEKVMRDVDAWTQELKPPVPGSSAVGFTLRARPPWCGCRTASCS